MPTYKVSQEPLPMVIDAPDEDAALEAYEVELERQGNRGLVVIEISDEPVQLTVDKDGYRVEEE